MKTKVEIISPTEAKECIKTPQQWEDGKLIGLTPCRFRWEQMQRYADYCKTAEANRRVFQIENANELEDRTIHGKAQKWVDFDFYAIGSIHEAEIIEGNKCIIL